MRSASAAATGPTGSPSPWCLLVAFHEILQQGALLVTRQKCLAPLSGGLSGCRFRCLPPFAFWRYYVTCYTLPRPWLEPLLEDIADHCQSLPGTANQPIAAPQAGAL
jgi:hypothetical protein